MTRVSPCHTCTESRIREFLNDDATNLKYDRGFRQQVEQLLLEIDFLLSMVFST